MQKIQNYIGGRRTLSSSASYDNVINPFSEQVIGKVPVGNAQDVEAAFLSASDALEEWKYSHPSYRAMWLNRLADAIDEHEDMIAMNITLNSGKPISEAYLDVSDSIDCYRYYANLLSQETILGRPDIENGDPDSTTHCIKQAVGVVGLITPWNFPTVTTSWKLAPALAAGCTVILKPSEVTPIPEENLIDICEQIQFPKGVINIVFGRGDTVGQALITHLGVNKVSFTGSTQVGRHILRESANLIKNISLELGGKSPVIVCKDADLSKAADIVLSGFLFNAGQMCSATSRLIVHEAIAGQLYEELVARINTLKIGDPSEQDTELGPLCSQQQYERVKAYFSIAHQENLQCIAGGKSDRLVSQGYFVEPTIYIDVPSESRLWNEEIFGPVLCCQTFCNIDEAIQIANNSEYGLAASVVGRDDDTVSYLARSLDVGNVWVNMEQRVYVAASWGGMKQSSLGRELGQWGLDAFLEVKHVSRPTLRHT
ncbi:aldehyde dehydrogenase family protein [Vibrio viridaestus]|uniref:aldehyde dehydrogenase (NAD(+)) n=1 Tax=Vibrio viridaestus TaxID=2487322 RepID=A0A3N9TDF2_9VIBR|nr:aldehyde dehydrogenase family protein [Vibrio viridaestus]RQW62228.1 aldehyde dehydrogenase family protein [Vibrio viridaestus]